MAAPKTPPLTPESLYAEAHARQFASKADAEAHFQKVLGPGRPRYGRMPLLPRALATLAGLLCFALASLVLLRHDLGAIQQQINLDRGVGILVVFLDEQSTALFKPEALPKYRHCMSRSSRTCWVLLQDVRTRPEIMVNPETRVQDACRRATGVTSRFGLEPDFEFALATNAAKTEATQCVLKNRSTLQSLDFLEFGHLALAVLLDLLGLAAFLLL
jgi:hypothetical protein